MTFEQRIESRLNRLETLLEETMSTVNSQASVIADLESAEADDQAAESQVLAFLPTLLSKINDLEAQVAAAQSGSQDPAVSIAEMQKVTTELRSQTATLLAAIAPPTSVAPQGAVIPPTTTDNGTPIPVPISPTAVNPATDPSATNAAPQEVTTNVAKSPDDVGIKSDTAVI